MFEYQVEGFSDACSIALYSTLAFLNAISYSYNIHTLPYPSARDILYHLLKPLCGGGPLPSYGPKDMPSGPWNPFIPAGMKPGGGGL